MISFLKKNTHLIFLSIILLLSSFLRLTKLSQTPSGFHADEASFYINAIALSQTGADEDGVKLPLSISSLIDPKPALFSYLQIPFINLFENQTLAARMPSAILGILSLLILHLLLVKVTSKKMALLTTFVLAISPWHIMISRGTQEVVASFFFLVASIYFLILLSQKLLLKNKKTTSKIIPLILITFLFFTTSFLSMYFYHSAKVLLPLATLGYLFFEFRNNKKFNFKLAGLIFATVVVAGATSVSVQESNSRISAVGILSDKAPQDRLLEQIYTAHEELSIVTTRVFYNKVSAYSHAIISEYVTYFSPDFLFLEGGKPKRYIVPDHGLIYLIELPLILLGIYTAISKKKKEAWLFLGLLFLAPVPSALTRLETPSIIRSFPMIISLGFFTATGILSLFQFKNKFLKYLILLIVGSIYIWQIGYFYIQYHTQAYYDQPWYRNSPYTEIAKEVSLIADNYIEIRVTNDLRPLYSYFVIENLIDIKELQENPYARNNKEYRLGKFVFNQNVCDLGKKEVGILYIVETQCRTRIEDASLLEVVKTINYQDGNPVYELLQLKQ